MSDLSGVNGQGTTHDAGAHEAPAAWGEPRARIISWYDPSVGLAAAAGLTGLEYVRGIAAGRVPPPPMASVVGVRLISIEEGEITIGSTPDESLMNTVGLVHGGVLCTLLDTAMGIAVQTTLGAGLAYASIELKVSFLKPVKPDSGELIVVGKVLKAGRRVSFAEGHAYSPSGALIGHGTSSLATLGA